MSRARTSREKKRQLGQFLTPISTARELVDELPLAEDSTVLEPSFGDGSFILPLVERFMRIHNGSLARRLHATLTRNVFGIEIDPLLHARCLERLRSRWGTLPRDHNLLCADFFQHACGTIKVSADLFAGQPPEMRLFDVIVGNPPFGGTIDPSIQDELDAQLGIREGHKIKKETYSFFIVKSVDLLATGGRLRFICSDTFLTIPTMKGLRRFLMSRGRVHVKELDLFSEETNQPMVVLDFVRGNSTDTVTVRGREVDRAAMELTGNCSWLVDGHTAPYFRGPKLGDFVVASSGMTIGNNALFVREIIDGDVVEPYEFEFFGDPITLQRELQRARLGHLSQAKKAEIRELERRGATRRNVRAVPLPMPRKIRLPHPDYPPYNKSCSAIVYAPPAHAIFWRDNGDAVLTFKRNGSWYLHGVGGAPYFKREGLTWQLIAPRLNCRYLPEGYILDSGAPCAFLRPGVAQEELYFILAWALSPLCERLLKGVLNHTRNIQSKDFERLPYPFWVGLNEKRNVIERMRSMVRKAMAGRGHSRDDSELEEVGAVFDLSPEAAAESLRQPTGGSPGGSLIAATR